ncbi:MAG: hypothetical protein GWP32_02130 [Bacteroidetes bacterium]|nr:hypothetical protein [Bacteroidota bacterium]
MFNSCASESNEQSVDDRLNSLLSKMTLEEKIGQMNQYSSFWDVTGPAPKEGSTAKQFEQLKNGLVGSMLNVHGVENVRTFMNSFSQLNGVPATGSKYLQRTLLKEKWNFTVQPGEFSIYVGGDSTANLTTKFNL